MRIKSIFTEFLILFVVACSPSSKNQNKLSNEQLAHLMFDIQLAETIIADLSPGQQDSVKHLFDKRLQEIYQLSPAEIKNEFDQLQADPEKLKLIITRAKEMVDSIK